MSDSPRLKGLELLRLIGAPVPEWQTARSHEDLRRLKFPKSEFGWTIRTCRLDGQREVGLYYLNNADREKVLQVLGQRLRKHDSREFYIVYPSWKFDFSCNVIRNDEAYIVEGMYGSQKKLSAGKVGPDFALNIPFGMRSQMTFTGSPSEHVLDWIGRILFWCARIPQCSFYTEVALTQRQSLMFYELYAL